MVNKNLSEQPDKILTFSNTMLHIILGYKNLIIGVICAVIAAGALWAGYSYFADKAETKAFASMYEVLSRYQVLSREKGASAAYDSVKKDFEWILDQYSGRNAAKLTRVIFAGVCYDAGHFDQAQKLYEESLSDFIQEPYKSLILSGLAYSCEAKKDYKNAAAYFEKIVAEDGALMKSEALFGLGRLYELIGEAEKSRDAYQRLVSEEPDSIYFEVAREKIPG